MAVPAQAALREGVGVETVVCARPGPVQILLTDPAAGQTGVVKPQGERAVSRVVLGVEAGDGGAGGEKTLEALRTVPVGDK